MPLVAAWCKVCIYFGFVFAWTKGARPRFDTSTDMGLVLVPADAEVDSVIFRLRATDQDADFPLVFEITATITPVVRIDNLPCTLYNKVCQANVILTKRLIPGRLHDFAVRVRDTKGDSNSMQATISVTNSTTPRDKIFPHIPSLIMVPEDTKPGKELDYLLVRANSWSGKPVYIELWQPKELFTIRQRQTPTQTRGIITLIGELDFETQSMYTLTMYATDPYTEPGKDTRNIAGLNVVVVVQDVQDVPPIFTLAPPLTRINNSVQPGDIILRVHAEDGDKGVPREIVYGLVSEGNPFTPFFNISETNGEIILAKPLEELTQITHVGAPVVLTVVAEEIRRSREEPPAQATIVEVGFLLGEPGNSPPYFESDNYVATIDENLEPGTAITFGEQYSTRVRDEDIGKAGVFALKLENNNGTFEINPTVAERTADFIITVRDNALIDYELYKSLSFKIIAQEVGPATNLSTSVPVTIFLRDVNDNPPVFDEESYEVTLSENVTAGTRVVQVHATDKDTGLLGSVRYTLITGEGSEAFIMDPDTGLITVAMGSSLDREIAPRLLLSVEARDENGNGNRGTVPLIVNLLDVNDNAPLFEKDVYEFMLNSELTNFTTPAFIKAVDADAEPPNNEVRYELIHGNYENKFYLNEITGELVLRSPITKIRRKKQSAYEHFSRKTGKEFVKSQDTLGGVTLKPTTELNLVKSSKSDRNNTDPVLQIKGIINKRRKRANEDALYTLTARAYDLGVPHLSSVTQIRILSGIAMEARIVMFVVPGEHPDSKKTAETLAAITGGRVTVLETRPYQQNATGTGNAAAGGGKKSIVIARVEQTEPGTPLVDVEKIRETLAANGVGIIAGMDNITNTMTGIGETKPPISGGTHGNDGQTTNVNNTITNVYNEEVTVYKAENKLLFWLLIILGLLMLLAIAALIICCICPGCPFYMAPRKRRVHSSETLVVRTDGRPKRHIHRRPATLVDAMWNGRKQAWSADPTRRNWQFNRRNTKNCGLSSLPGDVAYISGQGNDVHVNVESLRLRDGPAYDPSRRSRIGEQERMYVEDVDGQKAREYDAPELDSLQRHEVERGADVPRQGYRQRYIEPDANDEPEIREQHFYREGNAEVLRLVTRGQIDDTTASHYHHQHRHPTTLIVDGKDILLKRFIDDQKSRHDLSMPDIEATRSMESHQRSKDICQQQREIILIPERLDLGHRQHADELGPNVQRLVIDHSDYGSQKLDAKEAQIREVHRQERQETLVPGASMTERPTIHAKEHTQTTNAQSYPFHDLELARQNALLTRLLLERENRHVTGVIDSTSYLETQSLPGQVAIATQTDRTAATQTERQVRSRSDNDESDEDSRCRKKLKSKKKYGDGDWKRTRTLWMKSPIEEEVGPCFDKRLSILRKKVREVKEGRKIALEPNVLREISDSLDGNGSSYRGEEEESTRTYQRSEQTSIRYKVLNEQENDSPSSMEMRKGKYDRGFDEKTHENGLTMDATESTSSPEMKPEREDHVRGKVEEKSPRKDAKGKAHRKSEGVMKPSFRILEREITMLGKKLSKLGDKKFQESAGSDSTSLEKPGSMSKESRKDSDQKGSKKVDVSSSRGQKQSTGGAAGASKTEQGTSQRKEAAMAKTRQKFKYQQTQVMSTGSSEYDESFEKPRKQSSGFIQESSKQKPSGGYAKLKRQTQVERRETKKQVSQAQDQDIEKRKEDIPKETPRSESKFERSGKLAGRAPKLALVSRRDNVSEELSTSANSDRVENGKDTSDLRESDKKSHSESSGNGSNGPDQRKGQQIGGQVIERIIHRFVDEPIEQDSEKQMTADSRKRDTKEEKVTREMSSERNGRDKLQECKLDPIEKNVEQGMTVDVHARDVTEEKKTGEESPGINGKEKLGDYKLDGGKVLVENSDKENQRKVIGDTVDRDVMDRVTDSHPTSITAQKEESKLIELRSDGDERYDKRDLSTEFAAVTGKESGRYKEKDEPGENMINVEQSRVDRSVADKKVGEALSESKIQADDDKSSEETKKRKDETKGEKEKCKERSEVLDDAEQEGEMAREVEKHDLPFADSGKEIQERMVEKFQEVVDIDRLSGDINSGAEKKDYGVDSKSDTRRETKAESEKQETVDTSSDIRKDHARITAESVDENVDAKLPSDSKESIQILKTDESEDRRKGENLIEADKHEEETTESLVARDVSHDHDVREKNVFLGVPEADNRDVPPVSDVPSDISRVDDHRVVKKDIPSEISQADHHRVIQKDVAPETPKIDDHDDSPQRDISPQMSLSDDRQATEKIVTTESPKIDDRDISPKSDVSSKLSQADDRHATEKTVPPETPKIHDRDDSSQKDVPQEISQADHRHLIKTDVPPEVPKIESHHVSPRKDVPPETHEADHLTKSGVPTETPKVESHDVSRQRDVHPEIPQADHHTVAEKDVPPETSKIDDHDGSPQRDVPPKISKIDDDDISPHRDVSPEVSQKIHDHVTEKSVPPETSTKIDSPQKVDNSPQKDVFPKISQAHDHHITEKGSPEPSKTDDNVFSPQKEVYPEISQEDHHHRVTEKDVPPETSKIDDHDISPQRDVSLEISQAGDHRVIHKHVPAEIPETHEQRIGEKKDAVPEVSKDDDVQIENIERGRETETKEYSTPDTISPKTLEIQTHSDDENVKKRKSMSSSDDNDEGKRTLSHPKMDAQISQEAEKDSSPSTEMADKIGKPDDSSTLTNDKPILSIKSETDKEHKSKESEKSDESMPDEVKTSPVDERKSSEHFFGDKLILTDETPLAIMETSFDSSDKKIGTSPKKTSEQSVQPVEPFQDKSSESMGTKDPEDKEKSQVSTIDRLQETKSFRVLTPTSEMIVKEVPELDSVKSITVNGTKLSEANARLKLEIEETKLPEADQFRGEQSSSAKEGKSQSPLEDQLSGERDASKTDWNESSKRDIIEQKLEKPVKSEESFAEETDKDEGAVGERYADVSFPLFTSIIDTVDDSDESDSSSDISRKTTLTTRPYHTPRHRAAGTPEKESAEMVGKTEMNIVDSDEEGTLMIELVEDKNGEPSVDEESREIEDIDTDRYIAMPLIRTMGEEDNSGSREEVGRASVLQIPPVRDKVLSRADGGSTRERKSLESKSSLETDERLSENSKHSRDTGMKPETRNRGRTNGGKTAQTSISGDSKTEPRGNNGRNVKQAEKMKPPPPRKKSSTDESSEEKATQSQDHAHSRYRSYQQRGGIDQGKRKDVDQGKQKDVDRGKQRDVDRGKQRDVDQGKQKDADQGKQKDVDRGKQRDVDRGKQRDVDQGKQKDADQGKQKDVDRGKQKYADQGKQKDVDQGKQKDVDQGKQKDADQAKRSKRPDEDQRRKQSTSRSRSEKFASPPKTGEFDTSKAQPKYMAWYKQKREEMERKRAELRATDDEDQLPRWLRRSMKNQKHDKDERTKDRGVTEITPRSRRKIKPLVNVESEQLKAIVRQGRKLRRAEGGRNEDPPVQIFAATPPDPPPSDSKHHLVQHSEYKYEKIPPPFYLHPPPAPHPSPQLSPERFDAQPRMERGHSEGDLDSGIAVSHQGGNRLRHQQLLEKKSVFDIAYSEAAPSQLRADSTTPPS